jgi:hypothetical protein
MKIWKHGIIGLIAVIALAFTACDDGNGKTHTHSYTTTWSKNATEHWHECTANDGAKTDIAPTNGNGKKPAPQLTIQTDWKLKRAKPAEQPTEQTLFLNIMLYSRLQSPMML